MNDSQRTRGRLQFLLIAAMFFGPLLFAAWMYYGSDALQPQVWVVDEEDMTVHPQQVRLGEIEGDRIQVREGRWDGEHDCS